MTTLITLNIWGGYLKQQLLQFFQQHASTDIFCLQEVYQAAPEKISTCDMLLSLDIFHDIAATLPNHQGYFCPVVAHYGLAIFIKHSMTVLDHQSILIHENNHYCGKGPTHQRKMQCLTYQTAAGATTICNVHGLWNGQGKTDSPARLIQAQHIRDYLNQCQHPHIVCGDFNLEPHTQSLQLIKQGYTDLIADHQITSTRTSYYQKPIKFADYIFTAPTIDITEFRVLADEVSDHAPLYLAYN